MARCATRPRAGRRKGLHPVARLTGAPEGTTPVGLPERLRALSPSSGRFGLGGLFAEYARLYAAINTRSAAAGLQ